MTKRYCKNVDITDLDFIQYCIWDCLDHKHKVDQTRPDTRRIIRTYGTVQNIAVEMRKCIINRNLNLPPIYRKTVHDRNNGKLRELAVEDLWQQFFDYVATNALKDAMQRIGYYQTGCVVGKGQTWAREQLQLFMRDSRYCTKSDIKKCYPSIPQEKLMEYLKKILKNDPLIWLIGELIHHSCPDGGIPIGSRLSIVLLQLYMSRLYHYVTEGCYKVHGKREPKRVNLVKHILIFMDDVFMFSDNARDLHKAESMAMGFLNNNMGIHFKPDWTTLDCSNSALDAVGFKISREYIKMRRCNYLKTRKAIRDFNRNPSFENAQNLVSHSTNIKFTNSYHFRQKYGWKKSAKRARRIISNESKILASNGSGHDYHRWQYILCPTVFEWNYR